MTAISAFMPKMLLLLQSYRPISFLPANPIVIRLGLAVAGPQPIAYNKPAPYIAGVDILHSTHSNFPKQICCLQQDMSCDK